MQAKVIQNTVFSAYENQKKYKAINKRDNQMQHFANI